MALAIQQGTSGVGIKMNSISNWLILGGVAAALSVVPRCAEAQYVTPVVPATAPTSDSGLQLMEVVVTAQRHEERLQDVPISVNAISGETLAARGITDALTISQMVPGLTIVQTGTASTPYLRGVGSNAANPNNEASVATYVDGVYYASPYGNLFSFNNIQRIEVEKGPQGTLFGRNATGGVIQLITKDPSHADSLDVNVGYANYKTASANVYGTAGITQSLAADLAVNWDNQSDGWGRDLFRGVDVFKGHDIALRSKLLYTPTDSTKIEVTGDYGFSTNSNDNYLLPPGVLGIDGHTHFNPYFNTTTNTPSIDRVQQYGLAVNAQQDLGFARLVSITARRISLGLNEFDDDATPVDLVTFIATQDVRTWSQEIQLLAPKGSWIDWTTGIFFFDNQSAYDPGRLSGIAFAAAGGETDVYGRQHTTSASVYGQATAEVLPKTRLTIGIRETHEKETLFQSVGTPLTVPPTLTAFPSASQSVNKPTWRTALDYKIIEDVSAYISYNRGIKSGGYDLLTIGSGGFRPEVLNAYEAGVKSEFFNRRVRLNVAGFYYDYKDIQVSANPRGTIVTVNAASAKIKGFDSDVQVAIVAGLRFTGGASFLDGKYGNFPNPIVYPPSPFDPPEIIANANGHTTTRTPRWTANAGLDYSIPTEVGDFNVAGNVYYNTGFYWDVDNRLAQPPYRVINASGYWRSPDGKYGVKLWGKNLGNEHYLNQGVSSSTGDLISYAAPRTYGITLTSRF
jgi:iron complex outermembrane receptor protein